MTWSRVGHASSRGPVTRALKTYLHSRKKLEDSQEYIRPLCPGLLWVGSDIVDHFPELKDIDNKGTTQITTK